VPTIFMNETADFSKYQKRTDHNRPRPKRYPLEKIVIRKYGTLAVASGEEAPKASVTDIDVYKRNKRFGKMYGRIIDTLKDLN
jgi:hypothetical protein